MEVVKRRPPLIDLGLDRMVTTLRALGSPHEKLPPVFHVAGTNGKGSTIAFIRSILEAAGHSVHVFTSPHLVRYNERIVLAGEEISDDAFIDVVRRCDEAAGEEPLSFFETLTCAAFLAFSETHADYCIIEVGLGGRLDSTNVVRQPKVSVITPIGIDHQDYLGNTLSEIASEKAGIIKQKCRVVVGSQTADAMATLATVAQQREAPLYAFGQEWTAWSENGRLVYQDDNGLSDLHPPRLVGEHQFQNAGLAVAAIKAAELSLSDAVLSAGIENAAWPARLQQIRTGPIIDQCDGRAEVWLDGGHNVHAAKALALAIAAIEERSSKPLFIIIGMQDNKDARGFIAEFKTLASSLVAVSAVKNGAASATKIMTIASELGIDAIEASGLSEAVELVTKKADGEYRLLICGSLYLAGEVLSNHA